jgi:tetratricopeptide (TPR) repeat protein
MNKTAIFLSLTVLAALAALPSAVWGAPLQAKQRQMKTNEEYQAYMAMNNEKDPNQKLSLADAFVQKFPDSDFKDMAYFQKMAAYQQLGKVAEALDAGHKALDINPDSLDVINLEATLIPYYTFKAGDSAGMEMLSRAETDVKHGLDLLSKLTKPENVKPEDWDKAVKSARAGMNTALGYVALQKKDYASASTYLKAATEDNPGEALATYLLGQAYLYSTPPDYNNAIWDLARAVALSKAAGNANATEFQKFFDQVYVNRHGSDAGESDVIQQASASATPPQGFNVPPPERHKATGNEVLDFYYRLEDTLRLGGDQAKQFWGQVKGQPFAAPGQVDTADSGPDAGTTLVHIAITDESKAKEGAYDIVLADKQADAKYLQKGDPVHFQGTITDYTQNPSFSVTVDGTIDDDVLTSLTADRKKGKGRTKPKAH